MIIAVTSHKGESSPFFVRRFRVCLTNLLDRLLSCERPGWLAPSSCTRTRSAGVSLRSQS